MNPQIVAQNIRRLRVARGMSMQKLADQAGISLPAIKKIEGSKAEPRMNTMQAIAKALGANIQQLFVPVRLLRVVRFRSNKRMQNRENILARASTWLDEFNYLEHELDNKKPFVLKDVRSQCSRDDIVQAAALCREKLDLNASEPIYDICGLLESAGVKIYPVEMATGFFGLSIGEEDGGPAIVVNTFERITIERRIFSTAHELGHLMLHLDAFDVGKTEENKEEEYEADLFAGHFLMPDQGFRNEWNNTAGLHWVKRVLKVKGIYNVSYGTVLFRLVELGKADESVWKKFQFAYHSLYNRYLSRSEEPQRLKKFSFAEDRYSRLAREAVEKQRISASRGAEVLGITISEMRELMQNWGTVL